VRSITKERGPLGSTVTGDRAQFGAGLIAAVRVRATVTEPISLLNQSGRARRCDVLTEHVEVCTPTPLALSHGADNIS
jgi:hypothetical protein